MKLKTANIGEWSELYTFLKLLADGKIYGADKNIKKIESICYNIVKILRIGEKLEFIRDAEIRVVSYEKQEEILKVPISDFLNYSQILFDELKNLKGTFQMPEVWDFAQKIKLQSIKAKSSKKTDITLIVHDTQNDSTPTLNFSIKSQIGSPSTLLNASSVTNFTYKLIGDNLNIISEQFNSDKEYKSFKDKIQFLIKNKIEIKFFKVENENFNFNLKMIDSAFPKIMSELIYTYYERQSGHSIVELTEKVVEGNPLELPQEEAKLLYPYKIKEFLANIALGLLPNVKWSGYYEVTGGYIIVKDSGELLCYHLYNKNDFREYLFFNTKLETPGRRKHEFGYIFNNNNEWFLKLNLQIRFKK